MGSLAPDRHARMDARMCAADVAEIIVYTIALSRPIERHSRLPLPLRVVRKLRVVSRLPPYRRRSRYGGIQNPLYSFITFPDMGKAA